MSQKDTLLVVIRQAPQSGHWLQEALDAAMVGAAFGKTVSLLFMGQGVLALLPGQAQEPGSEKPRLPTQETLAMYDIQHLCVAANDLHAISVKADDLVKGITLLDEEQMLDCFADAANVLNF
ncbi:DsrE family protein [Halomonas llamarensis]|uniref:DsrE family protein n=1 Tax=Halomonas llamarensis TaxID=2945104 RepID=A0ABT0SQX3_9GAMM|nr:DsrE family protein [Halomonas llamarensis]MCL7930127.1 DsrE family protein [Halomonas llamarensis]